MKHDPREKEILRVAIRSGIKMKERLIGCNVCGGQELDRVFRVISLIVHWKRTWKTMQA